MGYVHKALLAIIAEFWVPETGPEWEPELSLPASSGSAQPPPQGCSGLLRAAQPRLRLKRRLFRMEAGTGTGTGEIQPYVRIWRYRTTLVEFLVSQGPIVGFSANEILRDESEVMKVGCRIVATNLSITEIESACAMQSQSVTKVSCAPAILTQ
jgi:hypothetical protein